MELILNNTPRWTKKHLDFFEKYQDCYEVEFSEGFYDTQLENINNGNPALRCDSRVKCYEIYEDKINLEYIASDNEYEDKINLGYIIVDDENEIGVAIFDDFAGHGHAYGAIKLFLDKYSENNLNFEAVVSSENKQKEKVEKVLEKLGFKYKESFYLDINDKEKGINDIWEFNR